MSLSFAANGDPSERLTILFEDDWPEWSGRQSAARQDWFKRTGFRARLGQICCLPENLAGDTDFVAGLGKRSALPRRRFLLARLQDALPEGNYQIDDFAGLDATEQSLGWLLGQYRFDRYKSQKPKGARLVAPKCVDAQRVEVIAQSEALTRDLINTPADDMGPDALEAAAQSLARDFGANFEVTKGERLAQEYPLIQAVGRAAAKPPRLIEFTWGSNGPTLVLVGKGVCFDTGGLNLKPSASMGLMKKDMGGAASVLGLARMIMALNLPLRLRVLIPAVENNVDGSAFRPGDVLTSRKGLTVEVNNTDAEGRLVLADALALADEAPPDLMISMATLTGAARVAVGPDLAPFYATDPNVAAAIRSGAESSADPVWEMPFHAPYEPMIEPDIADLDNAPKGGFAGSITAALFLRRFVTNTPKYVHFDIYGWQPSAAPGRPKGGVGQGTRALLDALPDLLGI